MPLDQAAGGQRRIIKTTCPRDCYDACGISVHIQGGRIVKVLGDRAHPVSRGSLCGKCAVAYNGAWRDPDKRLSRPLKRIGPKGQGRFVPVGWEQAITEIAGGVRERVDRFGAASILHTHYTGTCSLIAGNFPNRFFNRLGATEVDPDTVCNKAGHVALRLMFGDSLAGFDPRTVRDAKCLLVWGANPSASAPHVDRHWLRESPAALIVVDPIRHDTAKKAAIHLQPRPGTDAALAFALLHVLAREGLLNRPFIEVHVRGWPGVAELLAACTPDWGEQMTGVPAAQIEAAARLYGQGPSMLWLGQGLQRQPRGGNAFRAIALLPAGTGNIGRPGTGLLYMNGFAARGIDADWLTGAAIAPGQAPAASHMDLPAQLNDPAQSSALFTWNNNIAASSPNQPVLRQGLMREDLLHVAIELFATDTTDFADWVLPAASFLEFDDLVLSYFDYTISAQVKVSEPLGEALPNQEIFRRLSRAMGFADPELHLTDAELLATLLRQTGIDHSFATLSQVGTMAYREQPLLPFADQRYPTASGRIEVDAAGFLEAGLPPAPIPYADSVASSGRLRILSPASPWLMNSSYGNEPRIAVETGSPAIFLNPGEASVRGLTEDQGVVLHNGVGRVQLRVQLTADVPPGVGLVYKGAWPKRATDGANVNFLNPGTKSDLAESSSVHGIEAWLEPMGETTPPDSPRRLAR